MIEHELPAEIVATPLAAVLESMSQPRRLASYRGVITPQKLDDAAEETEALAFSAAVHDLGWLRRVTVKGEDRFRWLSGMVTNAVTNLPENGGAWNLVLDAQGHIQGDLHVWRENDGLELEIAADQYDKLLAHLDRFIIMDDVELTPVEGETALGLTGPLANQVLERMGLPVLAEAMTACRVGWNGIELRIARTFGALASHYAIWVPATAVARLLKSMITAGAARAGSATLEAFRIAEAIPAYGVDILERDLPQETSQTRALNFNKGCYLGQEIVERIRSRGNVHRHLRQLELDPTRPSPPAPGTELTKDGAPVGTIRSVATLPLPGGTRTFALAMIRAEAETPNQRLTCEAKEGAASASLLTAPPALRQAANEDIK